jgi:hypothetical protein
MLSGTEVAMVRISVLVLVAGIIAGGCASSPQPERAREPNKVARSAPGPDAARGTPVAIVRGAYIYESDLAEADIRRHIERPLIEEFIKANRLEPTKAQMASFQRRMAALTGQSNGAAAPEEAAALRKMAHAMVQQWLVNKSMYERYGGTVIFQQANPMEPVDAYRRFFEEHEARGTFTILDPEQREAFWSYYRRDHGPFKLPEEIIDFKHPWWEQTGPAR